MQTQAALLGVMVSSVVVPINHLLPRFRSRSKHHWRKVDLDLNNIGKKILIWLKSPIFRGLMLRFSCCTLFWFLLTIGLAKYIALIWSKIISHKIRCAHLIKKIIIRNFFPTVSFVFISKKILLVTTIKVAFIFRH